MYFLRRILFFVPLLLVISMLSFGLLRLAPGGPFDRERAPASAEIERQLRARYANAAVAMALEDLAKRR